MKHARMSTTESHARRRRRTHLFHLALTLLLFAFWPGAMTGQRPAADGEWRTWGGDLGNRRYRPFDQINAANFKDLEIAWRFGTASLGPRPEFNLQSTPLMVGGLVYTTAGSRRAVVALDAVTGEQVWMHSEREGARAEKAPRTLSGRGLAYWADGRDARILYVTPGYRLIALDARTGIPAAGFGQAGAVDLKLDDDQPIDLVDGEVGLHAAPIVSGNVIIIGAAHRDGSAPRGKENVKGYVRGYDVRTGKRLWIFHTIPRPGEFGHDTWKDDSWSYTGNAGVWTQMAIDEELGLAYLPVELPTGDYYGGHRPGTGLFGESLVAVDVKTGVRKWHFQFVHHGIWDMDIASPPILADIMVNGRLTKVVAQPTKQSWLYVFDRVTGKPLWPIEERPVPAGDVPGEWYAPTQPFVTTPPAYDRQGFSLDDVVDFTPEIKAEALALVSRYRIGPIFTPPSVSRSDGTLGTLAPANLAGANWPGGSFDPDTQRLYVHSSSLVANLGLLPSDPKVSSFAYTRGTAPVGGARGGGGGLGGLTVQGLPLLKPHYGRITAFDLSTGRIVWQVAHGDTPDAIRNHPALKGLNIARTGQRGLTATLVTRTLLIAGEPTVTSTGHAKGAMLRAYDKSTGADAGAVLMPAPTTGAPMTYVVNGTQYLLVAIGGAGFPAELVAYRLPAD
jgi:quinoprotein glucose dehydrogenase